MGRPLCPGLCSHTVDLAWQASVQSYGASETEAFNSVACAAQRREPHRRRAAERLFARFERLFSNGNRLTPQSCENDSSPGKTCSASLGNKSPR